MRWGKKRFIEKDKFDAYIVCSSVVDTVPGEAEFAAGDSSGWKAEGAGADKSVEAELLLKLAQDLPAPITAPVQTVGVTSSTAPIHDLIVPPRGEYSGSGRCGEHYSLGFSHH